MKIFLDMVLDAGQAVDLLVQFSDSLVILWVAATARSRDRSILRRLSLALDLGPCLIGVRLGSDRRLLGGTRPRQRLMGEPRLPKVPDDEQAQQGAHPNGEHQRPGRNAVCELPDPSDVHESAS
jgi:hypothetical protein